MVHTKPHALPSGATSERRTAACSSPVSLGQHDQLGAGDARVSSVLYLDPIRAAPGPIRPVATFGDDAFQTHAAGVMKHRLAVRAVAVVGQV
jgi:hypothetical protein